MYSGISAVTLSIAALLATPAVAQTSPSGSITADLRVIAQTNRDFVLPGDNLEFQFLVENLGPGEATGLRFESAYGIILYTVPRPAQEVNAFSVGSRSLADGWVCEALSPPPQPIIFPQPFFRSNSTLASLPAGASEIVTIGGTVLAGNFVRQVQGPIYNFFRLTSTSTDPDPGNNSINRIEVAFGSPALSIPSHSPLTLTLLALLLSSVVILRQRFDRS